MACWTPGGKRFDSPSMVFTIASAVASAFEPGRWKIAIATAGLRPR